MEISMGENHQRQFCCFAQKLFGSRLFHQINSLWGSKSMCYAHGIQICSNTRRAQQVVRLGPPSQQKYGKGKGGEKSSESENEIILMANSCVIADRHVLLLV